MSSSAAAPGGSPRQALAAGIACYLIWGFMPVLFIAMGKAGASPWEILAQRTVWSAPLAFVLVLMARQLPEVSAIFRRPAVLGWLACSTVLIAANWATFIWAVNNGHNLEASLGYYVNPLLNMAAGAAIFRERIDRFGGAAIALAVIGVALQTAALGRIPVIGLGLALAFWGYGVIRKRVDASAQAGLFIECLILFAPGVAAAAWLSAGHGGIFGHGLANTLLLTTAGPMTVIPLALFSWAARRLPLSTVGFLQFISPTIGFVVGLENGEALTPLLAASFAFIWLGAAVFIWGAWRAGRRMRAAV
jgi:chloramphenicol-sensitive protein RarD